MSAIPSPTLLGDVDAPRPVRAAGGHLALQGWCLVPGQAKAPPVRLVAATFTLPLTSRHARTDVPRSHPNEAAAPDSGFLIAGRVPPGVHLAQLEAQLPDGRWQTLRTLCLAAEAAPFAAGIDSPAAGQPVTQRVHVEGWALQPGAALASLALRYGHQEILCDTGRVRTDVPAAYPGDPQAARAGFKSRVILSAGRGPLRIKARLADGSARVARTALEIAVPTDENVGPEIDLAGERVALPRARAAARAAAIAAAAPPLNILFVLYGSFASNSALHVAGLANELAAAGHACAVAVPHDAATFSRLQAPRFRGLSHAAAAQGVTFANGRGPDVIHAWTTRENVRTLTAALRARHHAKVVVHLEDNEQQLLALHLQRDLAALAALPAAELDRLVPTDLSHPLRSRDFLAGADGVTVITDPLREFVPAGRACLTLPPAADARYFFPRPQPAEFRRAFLRRPDETVLFYHGNVHATNAAEMRELYAAVLQLNESGQAVTLLRTGRDTVDFLGDLAPRVAPHVVALGEVLHHHHLPPLMALADIFVQPGWDDAFNRYRLPSKLPEFFALGRPVVLPRTNLGTVTRHGVDAYVVDRADADGIAAAVTALRRDPALRSRLADGATAFAAAHFSWARSAAALAKFYAGLAA
jgi:glycosyltransferase involved in cell wall biosynthesis